MMRSLLFQTAVFLALLWVTLASPLELSTNNATYSPFVELFRERTPSGSELIWSGLHDSVSGLSRATLGKGKDCLEIGEVECDSEKNLSRASSCEALRNLLTKHGSFAVNKKSNQVCYPGRKNDFNTCCISWGKKIKGMRKSDLVTKLDQSMSQTSPLQSMYKDCRQQLILIKTVLSTCVMGDSVSGKMLNVRIAGKCTDVCLSNRGEHC